MVGVHPHSVKKFSAYLVLAGLVGLWTMMAPAAGNATESRTIERMIEATEPFAEDQILLARQRQELLAKGQLYFRRFCVHCHGKQGKGDGPASLYLFPKPRDLNTGIFKFRSTKTNAIPLDRDLRRTIQRGIPGTAMPAWGDRLPEEAIAALVEYIKTFSPGRFEMETPDFVMDSGLEPPMDSHSIQTGKVIYRQLRCDRCHGKQGKRQGPLGDNLKDSWGNTAFVYDLRQPLLYKGGASSDEIFRTLVSGMDGTPMNSYDYLSHYELWHLTHFLQSLFGDQGEGPQPPSASISLVSRRVQGAIDTSPDNPLWKDISPAAMKLMPLKGPRVPIHHMRIQSLHNGKTIAFRLQWEDPTPDGAFNGSRYYLDAVALQFAAVGADRMQIPFFGMGERDKPVNIWHWKADAAQSIDPGNSPSPASHVSLDPFRESPVEEINARGMGTLTVQSLEDQQLAGQGRWKDGVWQVVFVRDLQTPGPQDVQFNSDEAFLMSAAIWDGSRKDKNANKMVSLWQELGLD